ncbi:hypothetical protein FRC17_001997 [Serendipita sp. 399]|nr:hypothetical protein FRC17_001997 [Serendipita sp. 399]
MLKTLRTLNNVEMASAAWANNEIYIPSKAQLITSWALNHLLKHGSACLFYQFEQSKEFVEKHMETWLVSVLKAKDRPAMERALWGAGNDILLSLEAVKSLSQSAKRDGHDYFAQLQSICHMNPELFGLTHQLFRNQINAVKMHRTTLATLKLDLPPAQLYALYSKLYVAIGGESAMLAQLLITQSLETLSEVNVRDAHWRSALQSNLECCLLAITPGTSKISDTTIRILFALGRLDYSLLSPHVTVILRSIAMKIMSDNVACRLLLEVIIAYHSKTRTMDQLCNDFLEVAKFYDATIQSPKQLVNILSNGCVFGRSTMESLSEGISQFLTPGQIIPVLKNLTSIIEQNSLIFRDLSDENSLERGQSTISAACAFCLATAVIPSLPVSRLYSTTHDLESIAEAIGVRVISASLKQFFHTPAKSSWDSQTLVTSVLRLASSLHEGVDWIDIRNYLDEGILNDAETTLMTLDLSLPMELELEIVNLLLSHADQEAKTRVFQHVLGRLEVVPDGDWDGRIAGISPAGLKCAYWCMMSTKELERFTSIGTAQQLRQFSAAIISTLRHDQVNTNGTITSSTIIYRLFKTATFWEYKNLQYVFVDELVTRIHNCNLEELGNKTTSNPNTIEELHSYYRILMIIPQELFQSGTTQVLSQRAILADYAASNLQTESNSITETRIVFREFAARHLHDESSSSRDFISSNSALDFLCTSTLGSIEDPGGLFRKATLVIIEAAATALLCKRENSSLDIRHVFRLPITNADIVESSYLQLECWATCLFVTSNVLVDKSDLHDILKVQPAIDNLFGALLETLEGRLIRKDSLPAALRLLRALIRIKTAISSTFEISAKQISALLSLVPKESNEPNELSPLYLEIFSIQLDTLRLRPQKVGDFSTILALYILSVSATKSYSEFDERLANAVKTMGTKQHEDALELILGSLLDRQATAPFLLHAFSMLLRSAPDGTFLVTREYTSRVLGIFATETQHWGDETIDLKYEILESIISICQDKPALLQQRDVGSIMAVLSQMAQPSGNRTFKQTDSKFFYDIVKAAGALVRNRRDLVLDVLPHLAYLLKLLIRAFGATQANLGQKQRRAILGTLPPWVSLSQPLGGQEAAALSRLLTLMVTKTPSRSRSRLSSTGQDKAHETQSLLKPFGKHASSVLASYIELVTKQSWFISRQVRSEMIPGLYALCSMTGERGRDALMASLDPGGRSVLKSLWEAYERQRYVGQG